MNSPIADLDAERFGIYGADDAGNRAIHATYMPPLGYNVAPVV